MAQPLLLPSFAGGELAPALTARTDLAKYHVAARTLRNFFVHASGGASNRPGTRFVGRCRESSQPVRLVPFQFSTLQTYVLEFGHRTMRVIKDAGHVLEPAVAVTAIAASTPVVVTAPGHGFADGDEVFLDGSGAPLDGGRYLVAAAAADSFALHSLDGAAVDGTGLSGDGGNGTAARVYTLATPYDGTDLAQLKFIQSADTMTLCHPAYVPTDLSRSQHWVWTLTPITFQPAIAAPASASVTAKGGGSQYYSYVVTAVTDSPSEESRASPVANCQNAALNQNSGVVNTISWSAVDGASRYRVYKAPVGTSGPIPNGAIYGYVGSTTGTSFDDANIAADTAQAPPQGTNPFADGNNPACVTYYEQRKIFAASLAEPETVWMSQPGNFRNMDSSSPTRDSDAITLTIASRQINAVKHLVSVNALLALTASGAFRIAPAGQGDALTPTQTVVKPQAYNGCSDVPPLVIDYDILYVQAKGSTIRDLAYNFYVDLYTGSDLTLLSGHLFFGHQIREWAYAEEPFKLVWVVRDDGVLLCLTYLKTQEVTAWSRHDTQGRFRSVATVAEGAEDAVYFVVERTLPGVNGGQPVLYVERLASRNFLTDGSPDVSKAWFVDCGAGYDGDPATTIGGLAHLEGAEVAVLADGIVQPRQMVHNGTVTLGQPAAVVIAGLPYTADLQTLPLDTGEPTVQGRRKKISAVTLRVENTRGLTAGPDANSLVTIKDPPPPDYGRPGPLTTGDQRVIIPPAWTSDGSLWLRQDNPLPCTIGAVIPEVRIGDAPN